MESYQQAYLELLHSAAQNTAPAVGEIEPSAFVEASLAANRASRRAVAEGTRLLRESLFPVLDNILTATQEEAASLEAFAEKLTGSVGQPDFGLCYRIRLALVSRARHYKDRDSLIRELYQEGMALYNLETMLSPYDLRLYTVRMRMCFTESASYFDTQYDEITDPEIRGYIHRSMGNIALGYTGSGPEISKKKLAAIARSISILSDPEVRAKTPSLPWELYLYKSHQERTTLLSFLRSGHADPDIFAQVLESAQIVQNRQLQAVRERGGSLQPRWQYAYMAARYHCGAMLLPELLDGLYALSASRDDDDMDLQSIFSHVTAPALFLEYSKNITDPRRVAELAPRLHRMTLRMFSWLLRVPGTFDNEQLMFSLRQFLYTYRELPGGMPFFDVLQNVFALRYPAIYARMWIAGQLARQLMLWAVTDCPEQLLGLNGCMDVSEVLRHRDALADFACKAGRLYDSGMIHFFNLVSSVCRGVFEEEDALIQLHASCGAMLLGQHPSTAGFADVARGHHCYYNEKGGYPLDFSPRISPVRPVIYLVAAADTLASAAEECSNRYQPVISFPECCASLKAASGTRYAPFVVGLLEDPAHREMLQEQMEHWKQEAYLDMYRRRAELLKL